MQRLIGSLLEQSEFEAIRFENQPSKGGAGVPDAIIQSSIRLLLETKTERDAIRLPQIKRHLERLGEATEAVALLLVLNTRIRKHVGRDARNLQIGHSYLMQGGSPLKDIATLKRAIRDDIIPLLEEYCYEDYGTLANILGEQIVDLGSQRIRQEIFDEGQEDALIQGLLAPFVDIATSSEALATDESQTDIEEDDDEADS